jgi:hypothetical protein
VTYRPENLLAPHGHVWLHVHEHCRLHVQSTCRHTIGTTAAAQQRRALLQPARDVPGHLVVLQLIDKGAQAHAVGERVSDLDVGDGGAQHVQEAVGDAVVQQQS